MKTTYTNDMRETKSADGKRVAYTAQPVGRHVKRDSGRISYRQRRRNIQQIASTVVFLLAVICLFAFFGSYLKGYTVADVLPGVLFSMVVALFSGTQAGIFVWD